MKRNISKTILTNGCLSVTSEKGVLCRWRGLPSQDRGRHLLTQTVGCHLKLSFEKLALIENWFYNSLLTMQ